MALFKSTVPSQMLIGFWILYVQKLFYIGLRHFESRENVCFTLKPLQIQLFTICDVQKESCKIIFSCVLENLYKIYHSLYSTT